MKQKLATALFKDFIRPLAIVILFYSTENEPFQLVFSTAKDIQYTSSKELNKVNIQQISKSGLHIIFLGL